MKNSRWHQWNYNKLENKETRGEVKLWAGKLGNLFIVSHTSAQDL